MTRHRDSNGRYVREYTAAEYVGNNGDHATLATVRELQAQEMARVTKLDMAARHRWGIVIRDDYDAYDVRLRLPRVEAWQVIAGIGACAVCCLLVLCSLQLIF